ncbi:MAG TPA: SusC/RagA family TonB-linked outer membrane protein [Longimicrobiaceae bacterium]|nr:SusC/RagA family TonB-linked outer membrane protein [Longimicrobiaceae bacterium]
MTKLLLYALVLGVSLLAGPQSLEGQQRQITGTVTSAEGTPVAGAAVSIVGQNRTTQTDQQGQFTVSAPAAEVRLRVNRLGYAMREVVVPLAQATVNVRLEADALSLDAIVVTGQATSVARRNLAHAVASVSARDVERTPSQTVDKALQGKVPGALISTNSGAPGGGVQVDLRGVSSINGTADPLWVIDGVIVSNVSIPSGQNAVTAATGLLNTTSVGVVGGSVQDNTVNRVADLNPSDIESIEILKGASAAAIYGSKASNGVIIITTKRGREGAPQIRFSQKLGVYQLSNTLGARNFTRDEAVGAFGEEVAAYFGPNGQPLQTFDHEKLLAGREDLSGETALSISGGTGGTRYFLSGLLQRDAGIIENTGFDKQSVRLNLEQRLGSAVEVRLNNNLLHTRAQRGLTNNDNAGVSYYMVLPFTPNFVDLRRGADGLFPDNPFERSNPLQTAALGKNEEDVWRFISAGDVKVDLLQNDRQSLRFSLVGGADYFAQNNNLFYPSNLQFERDDGQPGTVVRGTSNNLNLNGNANLVHTFSPAGGAFTATSSVGVQYEDRDLNIKNVIGRNLIAGEEGIDAATTVNLFDVRQRVRDLGVYAQEELLLLDNRLLLTAGIRADRTSANGDDAKFYLYPKTSISYRLPELASFVDELKLRLAYGETGNQPLFGQKFTQLLANLNIGGVPGLVSGGVLGAPDIRPERQREIEGGFDLALFNGRANLEFTAYDQRISDLILQRTIAPSTGFGSEFFNGAGMNTRGVEVAVGATPIQLDRLTWTSRTTFYKTESEITELPVPTFRVGSFGAASLGVFQIEKGKSPTQIVGYNGRDANGIAIEEALGDATPDFTMGFTNELTFGPLTLYSLLDWRKGGDVVNLTRFLHDAGQLSPDYLLPSGVTAPRRVPECHPRCSGMERVLGFNTYTQQYIEDGSFVKLRELSLAYRLPEAALRRIPGRVRDARISLSGRNLHTWTDYTGLDPEVSNFGNQQIGRSVDVAPFPPSRSFWLSIDLGF